MKYIIAVKSGDNVEMFQFDTRKAKNAFLRAIEDFDGVQWAESKVNE